MINIYSMALGFFGALGFVYKFDLVFNKLHPFSVQFRAVPLLVSGRRFMEPIDLFLHNPSGIGKMNFQNI